MKWNDEVEEMITRVDQITSWLETVEGSADQEKDWHTSRNSARAMQYLKLARIKMLDMEYEEDPQGKKN